METEIIILLKQKGRLNSQEFLPELLCLVGSADVEGVLWRVFALLTLDGSLLPVGSSMEEIASYFDQLIVLAASAAVLDVEARAGVPGEACHV